MLNQEADKIDVNEELTYENKSEIDFENDEKSNDALESDDDEDIEDENEDIEGGTGEDFLNKMDREETEDIRLCGNLID